jgi:hypothetical protein
MFYFAGIQIFFLEIAWHETESFPIGVQVQDWFGSVLCFRDGSLHRFSWIERFLFLAYSLLFRRQRSEVCMVVLITYSNSLRTHDSNEPFPNDMRAVYYF